MELNGRARRNAALFVTVSLVAGFGGTAMTLTAGVWVMSLTGNSSLAAVTQACLYVPSLAGPVLGALADRLPRRPLLVRTCLLTAAGLLALLAVRDAGRVWLIFVVMFGYGVALIVLDAAEAGLLPAVLPGDALGSVNGLRMSAQEGVKLLSPLAGAGLFTLAGAPPVVVLSAAMLAASAALYAAIRPPGAAVVPAARPSPDDRPATGAVMTPAVSGGSDAAAAPARAAPTPGVLDVAFVPSSALTSDDAADGTASDPVPSHRGGESPHPAARRLPRRLRAIGRSALRRPRRPRLASGAGRVDLAQPREPVIIDPAADDEPGTGEGWSRRSADPAGEPPGRFGRWRLREPDRTAWAGAGQTQPDGGERTSPDGAGRAPDEAGQTPPDGGRGRPPLRSAWRAGLRHLRRQPGLGPIVVTAALAMIAAGLATGVVYAMIADGLGRPPAFIGVLSAVQGGGTILAGLLTGRLLRDREPGPGRSPAGGGSRSRRWTDRLPRGETGLAALGVALLTVATLLRAVPSTPVAIAAALIAGVGLPWTVVAAFTAVQRGTPEALLGRVSATAGSLIFGSSALATPAGAALLLVTDYRPVLAGAAAIALGAAGWLLAGATGFRPLSHATGTGL